MNYKNYFEYAYIIKKNRTRKLNTYKLGIG